MKDLLVSFSDKYDALSQYLKHSFGLVFDSFCERLKDEQDLDDVHYKSVYGNEKEKEASSRVLYVALLEHCKEYLSPKVIDNINEKMRQSELHMQEARIGQMEPHEQELAYRMLDKLDRQQDAQDKIDMYRNEY